MNKEDLCEECGADCYEQVIKLYNDKYLCEDCIFEEQRNEFRR